MQLINSDGFGVSKLDWPTLIPKPLPEDLWDLPAIIAYIDFKPVCYCVYDPDKITTILFVETRPGYERKGIASTLISACSRNIKLLPYDEPAQLFFEGLLRRGIVDSLQIDRGY